MTNLAVKLFLMMPHVKVSGTLEAFGSPCKPQPMVAIASRTLNTTMNLWTMSSGS